MLPKAFLRRGRRLKPRLGTGVCWRVAMPNASDERQGAVMATYRDYMSFRLVRLNLIVRCCPLASINLSFLSSISLPKMMAKSLMKIAIQTPRKNQASHWGDYRERNTQPPLRMIISIRLDSCGVNHMQKPVLPNLEMNLPPSTYKWYFRQTRTSLKTSRWHSPAHEFGHELQLRCGFCVDQSHACSKACSAYAN